MAAVFAPIGLYWQIKVALIAGTEAPEVAVASLGMTSIDCVSAVGFEPLTKGLWFLRFATVTGIIVKSGAGDNWMLPYGLYCYGDHCRNDTTASFAVPVHAGQTGGEHELHPGGKCLRSLAADQASVRLVKSDTVVPQGRY